MQKSYVSKYNGWLIINKNIGISSGAVLAAAKRMAKRIQKGNIVMIFADGGWKYLPTRPWEESLSDNSQEKNDIHWFARSIFIKSVNYARTLHSSYP